jgi:hypothetical protein
MFQLDTLEAAEERPPPCRPLEGQLPLEARSATVERQRVGDRGVRPFSPAAANRPCPGTMASYRLCAREQTVAGLFAIEPSSEQRGSPSVSQRYARLEFLRSLDPERDCDRICNLSMDYEFPWDFSFSLSLALLSQGQPSDCPP